MQTLKGLWLIVVGVFMVILGVLRLKQYGFDDGIGWVQIVVGSIGVGALAAVLMLTRNGWGR